MAGPSFKVRLGAIKAKFGVESSQPDHLSIVQAQALNGCSAARRHTDDLEGRINRPLKVVVPALSAWIEQRNDFAGNEVQPVEMIEFVTVTDRTCEGHVIQLRSAATADRMNVVQLKTTDLKPTGQ
jgi:hypothetical protein